MVNAAPSRAVLAAALAIVLSALAGCAAPPPVAPGGSLKSARLACNEQYPEKIGNYVPHARCVNAAIETYALSGARHPDLIRLQEEARVAISEQIDRRRISPQTGIKRMREVDALITRAERDRDAGNMAAANRHRVAIDYLLVQ
jgi:hypothetical protein